MARKGNTVLVMLGLGLAFAAAAGGGNGNGNGNGAREPNGPVEIPETEEEAREFAATVCVCAAELANASAEVTPEALRVCLVDRWWPTTFWPPIAADPQSVKDAWQVATVIVAGYLEDPELFSDQFCPEEGAIIGELEIGDVVHTGAINIAAVCAPPLPQEVPIRILFAGDLGVSAQAWDFLESEWQDIRDELGDLRYFANPGEAIDATRAIVLGFAGTFCSTTIPAEPTEPAEPPAPTAPGDGPGLAPPPEPDPTFSLPVDFERVPIPPIEQYPWEAALIHEGENGQHWPTPGMFFLVRDDAAPTDPILALDSMLGIARVALSSAYAMAGAARQLADIPAEQVLAYLSLIVCSPWNDVAYGATSADVVGGELGLGPHARGVNMLPRHHNNIGELMVGNSPRRTTTLAGGVDSSAEGTNTHWPQLWLPPIRLEMLRDLGVVSTAGDSWSNGDSVIVPPPAVWDHPVHTTVSPPGGSWGC